MRRFSLVVVVASRIISSLQGAIPAARAGGGGSVSHLALGDSMAFGCQPGKGQTSRGSARRSTSVTLTGSNWLSEDRAHVRAGAPGPAAVAPRCHRTCQLRGRSGCMHQVDMFGVALSRA
jgi:hypothetical protein